MQGLKLKILGRFEAHLPSGESVSLPTRKTETLLAYLALVPGPHSRDHLSNLLWGDRSEGQARNSLRQALNALKKLFVNFDPPPLRIERTTVDLNSHSIKIDAFDLEALIKEQTPRGAAQAVKLYRGEFLEGVVVRDLNGEEWLAAERSRFRRLATSALEDVLAFQLDSAEFDNAEELGEKLVSLDGLNESAWRTLMHIYAARGNRNHALMAYKRCCEILSRELGVEPSEETSALECAIREGSLDVKADIVATQPGVVNRSMPTSSAALTESQHSIEKPSIAILPFENMSDDPEQEYFSDGITEDIITELSRFRSLFVIARNSSFTFKDAAVDVTEVGRKLGVSYIVEGSVRKVGNRVRISAQLVEAATGNHLWAERYDRELEDIFAVQDEVVQTITSTIGGRVEYAGRQRAERLSGESLLAYDHVLRGIAAWLRNTREDNGNARRHLEQAIDLDPLNPQAHRWLSEVLISDWMAHWVADRKATLLAAYENAKTAVTLDDSFSEALATLGSIQVCRREYGDAQRNLERAVRLNPNDTQALGLYGYFLVAVGRVDEALIQLEISERINPFQAEWVDWVKGCAYFTARRYVDAIGILRTIKDPVNEVRGWLAASYAGAGQLDEARATLGEFLRVAEDDMEIFPGNRPGAWKNYWQGIAIQYQDQADFEHLYQALIKSGLED